MTVEIRRSLDGDLDWKHQDITLHTAPSRRIWDDCFSDKVLPSHHCIYCIMTKTRPSDDPIRSKQAGPQWELIEVDIYKESYQSFQLSAI